MLKGADMSRYKKATIEEHYEMGRAIADAEDALGKVLKYSRFYRAADTDKIINFKRKLGVLRAHLDDVMFRDHPEVEYVPGRDIYYGTADEALAAMGELTNPF